MRSRLPLLLFLLAGASAVALPHVAHATGIPYWGPIIPAAWDLCPSNWVGLITVANNIIAFGITMVLAVVSPLMFAYVGFLYVMSGENPGERSRANGMILNLVVGIVIALSGYLVVDFLLTSLTTTGGISAWTSQMFTGGSTCLSVASSLKQSGGATGATCPSGQTCQSGVCYPPPAQCGSTMCQSGQVCGSDGKTCVYPAGVTCGSTTCSPDYTCDSSGGTPTCKAPQTCSLGEAGITGTGANGGQVLSYGSGPCDASTLLSDTNNTLTTTQADTFACIAKYEDSCQTAPSPPNYCWNKDCNNPNAPGAASTAAGAFQVLLSSNSSCYDNSVCETAAGVSGPLNCASAFTSKGYVKTDPASQAKITTCLNAANSLSCSITAAQCLLNKNGGSFSAWTSDKGSSGQAQCIANGGG